MCRRAMSLLLFRSEQPCFYSGYFLFEFVKYVEQNKTCKIQLPDNQIITGSITGKLAEMDSQAQTVRYVIKPVFPDVSCKS